MDNVVTYDLEPRDPGEFLDDMEQIENKQDPRKPEATHSHGVEPSSPAVPAMRWHRYAYESQEIQYLKGNLGIIIIHESRSRLHCTRIQSFTARKTSMDFENPLQSAMRPDLDAQSDFLFRVNIRTYASHT